MATFEPIDILEIARKYGVKEYRNTTELKEGLQAILKTPKYVLGFLKYKEEIECIKSAIRMLEDNGQVGYKIVTKSEYKENKVLVFIDSNDELNLFIQLMIISNADIFAITDETVAFVKRELLALSEEKNILIGYYFLIYLDYLEYIELEKCEYDKVYSRLKEIAGTEYYSDKIYKKIAERYEGVHSYYNDFCAYALALPLLISIIEYKHGDKQSSIIYLEKMISDIINFEIKFEKKMLSCVYENYILYEKARRLANGEGVEISTDNAMKLVNIVQDSLKKTGTSDVYRGYVFEEPSKGYLEAQELLLLTNNLSDYIIRYSKNEEAEFDRSHLVKELNTKPEKNVETINTRDWEKVYHIVDELNAMHGLASVKRKVKEILDNIKVAEYKKENFDDESDDLGTMHLIFTGNAGTGKTTVARMLGKIYGALGIIRDENLFVECGRVDLIGQHVGSTAPKVKKMVESAMGGILFIDEAYSLTDGGDSFGTEAVNTLLAEVENHRKEIIVILAGYKDKMQEFLRSNQGLASRFSTEIYFEDYSSEDMLEIIKKMANDRTNSMYFKSEVEAYLLELFQKKLEKENDFGNARGVRNVFENIIRMKNTRTAEMISQGINPTKEEMYTFELEDVIKCARCDSLMNLRKGPYGRFMSCKNYRCKNTMSVERYYQSRSQSVKSY